MPKVPQIADPHAAPAHASGEHANSPHVDTLVDAACWNAEPRAEAVIAGAIAAAAKAIAFAEPAEIAVLLTDDGAMQALNKQWRGLDKPTNVLSFPAVMPPGDPAGPRALGDIALAYETCRREAEADRTTFAHHLSHLAVHGFLHLVGYDHMTDDEAETMERIERDVLANLGIADPYAAIAHED